MTTTETNPIDQARLEAFVGQAVTDMGAAISGLLLHMGDRLGLYKAMAGARAQTPGPPGGRPRPPRRELPGGARPHAARRACPPQPRPRALRIAPRRGPRRS